MLKENRSLSPHLYLYKPQITSVVSIFHRISGSVLSLFFIYSYSLFVILVSFSSYCNFYFFFLLLFIWHFFSLIFFILVSTIFFHFMNGVRHILWDLCLGLDLNNLFITGCFVLFITLLLSFVLVIL